MSSVGMRISLKALLETEKQHQTDPPQFFSGAFIYSFVQPGVNDPKNYDELSGYLNHAKGKGYVEKGFVHMSVGKSSEAMVSSYRIKQDRMAEIEKLLANE